MSNNITGLSRRAATTQFIYHRIFWGYMVTWTQYINGSGKHKTYLASFPSVSSAVGENCKFCIFLSLFHSVLGLGLGVDFTFTWDKGLFINYFIFFFTIPDPYPPLCHPVSSFDIPPPTPLPDDVIYEWEMTYP